MADPLQYHVPPHGTMHYATNRIYDSVFFCGYVKNTHDIHMCVRKVYPLVYFADRTRISCRIFCVFSNYHVR